MSGNIFRLLHVRLLGCVVATLIQSALCVVSSGMLYGAQAATATLQSLHHPVPGGVAVVSLPSTGRTAPKVTFNRKPVLVVSDDRQGWVAVVGLPLDMVVYEADSFSTESIANNESLSATAVTSIP